MAKTYTCDKCLHEFSRKQHLAQHYNRKFPCMKSLHQINYSKDGNILPNAILSSNISVSKTLPNEEINDHKHNDSRAEPASQPEGKSKNESELILEHSQPKYKQHAPCSNSNTKKYHNKSVKIRFKFNCESVKLEKRSEYDELFKRVKKFFRSEQVITWLQEEDIEDPINPTTSIDDLRGWYKDFRSEIENEYRKIKILD